MIVSAALALVCSMNLTTVEAPAVTTVSQVAAPAPSAGSAQPASATPPAQPGYVSAQPTGIQPYEGASPPVEAPEHDYGPRFGLFLGGLTVPGVDLNAIAGGAMYKLKSARTGWEARFYGGVYRVESTHTTTTGGV